MTGIQEKINKSRLPEHIAIIMDGNGRWAKSMGKSRIYGHRQGVKTVQEIVEAAAELGLHYLTLYTFSTENWLRPKTEINSLMNLLVGTIKNEVTKLIDNNIKLLVIGDIGRIPENTYFELSKAIEKTKNNTGLSLIMALSYSSKWDILNAAKTLAKLAKQDIIDPDMITEEFFSSKLSTAKFPDPELLIRTSGEYRISNFLLWELAYTELFFTEKKWPEFNKNDFYQAIIDFQGRERRFGKVSEQVK
jgi:undecaprenyl diphosphate synthase